MGVQEVEFVWKVVYLYPQEGELVSASITFANCTARPLTKVKAILPRTSALFVH